MSRYKTSQLTAFVAVAVVLSMLLWNIPTTSLHNNGLDTNNGDEEDYIRVINYYDREGGNKLGTDSYYLGETAEIRFDLIDSSVKVNGTYKAFLGWSLTPGAAKADYYTDVNSFDFNNNNRGDTPGGERYLPITFDEYRNYNKAKGICLYAVWGDVIPVTLTSGGSSGDATIFDFNVDPGAGANYYKTKYDRSNQYPNAVGVILTGGSSSNNLTNTRVIVSGTGSSTAPFYLLLNGVYLNNNLQSNYTQGNDASLFGGKHPLSIETETAVRIQSIGINALTGQNAMSGIHVPYIAKVMFEGRSDSSLTVKKIVPKGVFCFSSAIGGFGMGYGSSSNRDSGVIQFESGTVTAFMETTATRLYSAVIGGAGTDNDVINKAGSSTVFINGGAVNAMLVDSGTSGFTPNDAVGVFSAGIGAGSPRNGDNNAVGRVTITGGTVRVDLSTGSGTMLGAGIGGGGGNAKQSVDGGSGGKGTVTITGGNISVKMDAGGQFQLKAAAIGGGGQYTFNASGATATGGSADIRIYGGTITTHRVDPVPNSRDIGHGAGGTPSNIYVSGGSISVSDRDNIVENVYFPTYNENNAVVPGSSIASTKYVLDVSRTLGAPIESFMQSLNNGAYIAKNIGGYHESYGANTSGINTQDDNKLYVYLPSALAEISVGYGTEGEVLHFGRSSTLSPTNLNIPAYETYYRVIYVLDRIRRVSPTTMLVDVPANADITAYFALNADLDTDEYFMPFDFYVSMGGAEVDLSHKDDPADEKGHYERQDSEGVVDVYKVNGNVVFAAGVIKGVNVTYDASENNYSWTEAEDGEQAEGLFFISKPLSVGPGEGLEFIINVSSNVGGSKYYVIEEVRWKTTLNEEGGVIPGVPYGNEDARKYTLPAGYLDSDVTITIRHVEAVHVEYEYDPTDPNFTEEWLRYMEDMTPSYVAVDGELVFGIGFDQNYRPVNVEWKTGVNGTPVPFNNDERITDEDNLIYIYKLDAKDHGGLFTDTLYIKSYSTEVVQIWYSTQDEGITIAPTQGSESHIVNLIQISETEWTVIIDKDDRPNGYNIYFDVEKREGINIVDIIMLKYNNGKNSLIADPLNYISGSGFNDTPYVLRVPANDFWSIIITTNDVYVVGYVDNDDVNYNTEIGAPDIVNKGDVLEFEIYGSTGHTISHVYYFFGVVIDETTIPSLTMVELFPDPDEKGRYSLPTQGLSVTDDRINIYIVTEKAYRIRYDYSQQQIEDVDGDLEIKLNGKIDFTVTPRTGYVLTDIFWEATVNGVYRGGTIPLNDQNVYEWAWQNGLGSDVKITILAKRIYAMTYEDQNGDEINGSTEGIKNYSTTLFPQTVDSGGLLRLSSLEVEQGYNITAQYSINGTTWFSFNLASTLRITADTAIRLTIVKEYKITYTGTDKSNSAATSGVTFSRNNLSTVLHGADLTFVFGIDTTAHRLVKVEWRYLDGSDGGILDDEGGYYALSPAGGIQGDIEIIVTTEEIHYLIVFAPMGVDVGNHITVCEEDENGLIVEIQDFEYDRMYPILATRFVVLSISIEGGHGYSFVGWERNGQITGVNPNEYRTNMLSDRAIRAILDQHITLTFDIQGDGHVYYNLDGGSNYNHHADSITVLAGQRIFIKAIPSVGYTFSDWNGTDIYDVDGATLTVISWSDLTLTATFVIKTFNIIYDAGYDGPSDIVGDTANYGDKITLRTLATTFVSRPGYNMIGWTYDGGLYAAGGMFVVPDVNGDSITFTAEWEMIKVTVTFVVLEGTGGPTSQVFDYGVPAALDPTEPVRNGYSFLGWSTNGVSVTHTPGMSCSFTANTNLFAIWILDDIKVTYKAGSGVGNDRTQNFKYDTEGTLIGAPAEWSKTGHHMIGWSEDPLAVAAQYSLGGKATFTADTTLYAVWEPNTYVITYHGSGLTPYVTNATHGDLYTFCIGGADFEKPLYDLIGWSLTQNGTKKYDLGEKMIADETLNALDLYPVWVEMTYTVVFEGNGGVGAPAYVRGTLNEFISFPSASQYIRENMILVGWSKNIEAQPEDVGIYTSDDQDVPFSENTTYYAVWQINEIPVTYRPGIGASGSEYSEINVHGKVYTFYIADDVDFVKDWHHIIGWTTTDGDSIVEYGLGGKDRVDAPIILYPVWELTEYTVTFDGNGGSGTPLYISGTNDDDIAFPSDPEYTLAHKMLVGWSKDKNAVPGSAGVFTSASAVPFSENVTYYAVWDDIRLTVTYNKGEYGTGSTKVVNVVHGDLYTFCIAGDVDFEYTGYHIIGWSATDKATQADYSLGDKMYISQSITLYPVWDLTTYKVLFNSNGGIGAPTFENGTIQDEIAFPSASQYILAQKRLIGWSEDQTAQPGDAGVYTSDDGIRFSKDTEYYAVWGSYDVPVTYTSGNDATSRHGDYSDSNVHGTLYTFYSASRVDFFKTGFHIVGWAFMEGGAKGYELGDKDIINDPITLYPVWEVNSPGDITITYDENYGRNPARFEEYGKDGVTGSITIRIIMPRQGYDLIGWSKDSSAVDGDVGIYPVNYNNDVFYTFNGDTTLYAVWKVKTFEVIFEHNDERGQFVIQEFEYGISKVMQDDIPQREGYTFGGWATRTNGSGTVYHTELDTVTATFWRAVSLYAVWMPNVYDVTYNRGDDAAGTGPFTDNPRFGEAYVFRTVDSVDFERTGYQIIGWKTKDGREYGLGERIRTEGGLDLFPIWDLIVYNVILNPNGATGKVATMVSGTINDNIPFLSPSDYALTHKILVGWSEDEDAVPGDSGIYTSVNTTKFSENTTYFAVWDDNLLTVTYKAGSGATGEFEDHMIEGYIYAFRSESVTGIEREHHYISGWATADGGAKVYGIGDTIILGTDLELYPVWIPIEYTVTFNPTSGTGSPLFDSGKFNEFIEFPTASQFSRPDHVLVGWSLVEVPGASDRIYTSDDEVLFSANDQYFAVWAPLSTTVTYDVHGGTGWDVVPDSLTISVRVDDPYTIFENVPTRDGYTFGGWLYDGNVYNYDDSIRIPVGGVSLVAVWNVHTVDIEYDVGEGSGAPGQETVDMGSVYTVAPDEPMPKDGETYFAGWMSSEDGRTYLPGQLLRVPVKTSGYTLTLTAVWSPWPTVVFDYNDGSSKLDSVTAIDGLVSPGNMPADPTREGYTFDGWYDSVDTQAVYDKASGIYDIERNMRLVAKWIPHLLTITYLAGTDGTSEEDDGFYSQTAYYDEYKTLFDVVDVDFKRSGYHFIGWSETDGGVVVDHRFYETRKITSDMTLFPVWVMDLADQITITYTYGSGTHTEFGSSGEDGMITYFTFERLGFRQTGWSLVDGGNDVDYRAGDTYNFDVDTALYAVWESMYTIEVVVVIDGIGIVEYSLDGITFEKYTGPFQAYVGQTIYFREIHGDDQEFKQWSSNVTPGSRGGDGSVIVSGQKVVVEAVFETVQYNMTVTIKGDGYVEYSINGEDFVKYSGSVKVHAGHTVILRAYANEGYNLKAWSGSVSSTDVKITISSVTDTITLNVVFAEETSPSWFLYATLAMIFVITLLFIRWGKGKGE